MTGTRRSLHGRRTGRGLVAGLAAIGALGSATSPAAAQSRTAAGATEITPNVFLSYTFGAADDANQASGVPCDAQTVMRPVFHKVTGTGGRIIVTTDFSETVADSMLFNYGANRTPPSFGPDASCGDDNVGPRAQMAFASTAGATHILAVGVCCSGALSSGRVGYSVITNDQRAHAVAPGPEHFNQGTSADDPGEPTSCAGLGYSRTTWYTYTAPARGTITPNLHTVPAAGAITAFRGASTTPIGCAVTSQGYTQLGPIDVSRGETVVLQAGTTAPSLVHVSSVNFVRNPDQDADGVNGDQDCNDENPAIRPGVPEILNNPVDENCDGIVALDRDGDGELARPGGPDCDDGNRRINSKAREIRGNRVDEDCRNGAAPLRRFNGKPDIKGSFVGRKTFVRSFSVSRVPAGTTVRMTCSRCKRRAITVKVRVRRSRIDMATRLRPRILPPGTKLELRISCKDFRTEALRVTLRPRRAPIEKAFCGSPKGPLRRC